MNAVKILSLVAAIIVLITALVTLLTEGLKLYKELPRQAPQIVTVVATSPESTSQNSSSSTQAPGNSPIHPTSISPSDSRDVAAQTLGYADLDDFMSAFEISAEVKPRIFVCPNEKTWCLGVYEETGQADFRFKNGTKCAFDGKQANGISIIPAGFDGMVKGFTVRPCSR